MHSIPCLYDSRLLPANHVHESVFDRFSIWNCWLELNSDRQRQPEARLSRGGGEQNNRKWVQICLSGWLITVDCIVYSNIVNTFNSSYLQSILSIAIIETPECQHGIVWQWAAFWAQGNGKLPTMKQRKFDLNLPGKWLWFSEKCNILQQTSLYLGITFCYLQIIS